jgi:hypothetical protein
LQNSSRMKLRHHHFGRRKQTISKKIVQLNGKVIKGEIKELVQGNIEEILN